MSDNKIKMLLVDDSASMREMVSFTLKGAGYEVFKATDGVEALDFAQGISYNHRWTSWSWRM